MEHVASAAGEGATVGEPPKRWYQRSGAKAKKPAEPQAGGPEASGAAAATTAVESSPRASPAAPATGWFARRRTPPSSSAAPELPSPPAAVASSPAPAPSKFRQRLRSLADSVEQIARPLPLVNEMIVPDTTPWPAAQPAGTANAVGPTGPTTPAPSVAASAPPAAATAAAAASSSPSSLPSPSTAVVSITTLLNPYSDLSEVSGLILCPGFTRASALSALAHSSSDPVPSHAHPESISPTLLPPLPTVEERKQAMEVANAQHEQDEEKANAQIGSTSTLASGTGSDLGTAAVPPTNKVQQALPTDEPSMAVMAAPAIAPAASSLPPPPSIASKLRGTLGRLATTPTPPAAVPPAVATTAAAPSGAAALPSAVPIQPVLSPPSSHFAPPPAADSIPPSPLPPTVAHATQSWVARLMGRAAPGDSTTLDLIENHQSSKSGGVVPPATVAPANGPAAGSPAMADGDSEFDLRAGLPAAAAAPKRRRAPQSQASQSALQIANKRANQLMQQMWLIGNTTTAPEKETKEKEHKHQTEAATEQPAATATPSTTTATAATTPATAVPSVLASPTSTSSLQRLASLFASSAQAASSLASSAVYWTLGPFDPHTPELIPNTSTASRPVEEAPAPPVAPPPPPPPPPPPLHRTLRKVVIIGVHGWSALGGIWGEKPIVVSHKFCQMAQRALATYCRERGDVDLDRIQVCSIPLHGHGKVEQRVAHYLHHQLPLFQPYLRTADAILVVAHSQGVLVSVSLMHQLILQGWISPARQHISMQLMAGLHHGPFPDLISDLYSATKELFSYCYVDSEVHRRYMQALHELLESGVKVVCIGSVHDQAVPLYSSLLQSFPSNPNLLRAVYVDYSTYQPDFLYALVNLVVYLMNTGVHGGKSDDAAAATVYIESLVHLSGWLRGGLLEKNGGAHSAIHRLTDCYNLGIEWAMAGRGAPTTVHVHSHSFAAWAPYFAESFTNTRMNRYMMVLRFRELFWLLPSTELNGEQELTRLYQLYSQWLPRTKQLKQLKEAFAPLFGVDKQDDAGKLVATSTSTTTSPSVAANGKEESRASGKEDAKSAEKDKSSDASPAGPTVAPTLSRQALLALLKPSRLAIVPAVLPSSWQMNGEDATSLLDTLADPPIGPPLSGKRNKRLRHVKELTPEEEAGLVDAERSPAPEVTVPDVVRERVYSLADGAKGKNPAQSQMQLTGKL